VVQSVDDETQCAALAVLRRFPIETLAHQATHRITSTMRRDLTRGFYGTRRIPGPSKPIRHLVIGCGSYITTFKILDSIPHDSAEETPEATKVSPGLCFRCVLLVAWPAFASRPTEDARCFQRINTDDTSVWSFDSEKHVPSELLPMIFNSWLRSLRNKTRRSQRRFNSRSPQSALNARLNRDELEVLEDRTLLTIRANFTSVIAGLTLSEVINTDDADEITISQSGNSLVVSLTGTDDATGLPARFDALSSLPGGGLTYFTGIFTTNNPANADRLQIALGGATLGTLSVFPANRDDSITMSNVNLSLSDVRIFGGAGSDMLLITNSGLNLAVNGGSDLTTNSVETIRQEAGGALTVSGATNMTLTSGFVQLNLADNNFGGPLSITADGSTVLVQDADDLSVNDIRADTLLLTAPNSLTQDLGSTVSVTVSLTLNSSGDIVFANQDNSIPAVQVTQGQNVTVSNTLATSTTLFGTSLATGNFSLASSDAVVNGTLTVGGDLTLDASNGIGSVTDGLSGRITVAGSTSILVDPLDNVILDAVTFTGANAHDFHGPAGMIAITAASNVNIRHRGNLNFIIPAVTGALSLAAEAAGGEAGDILDADGGTQSLIITGLTTLEADGDIVLDAPASDYRSLNIVSANNASVLDTFVENGLTITGASVAQSLNIATTGGMNLTGNVISGQDISLTAQESTQLFGPDILTDDLTFSPNVVLSSVSGNITLNVADDVVMLTSNIISASNGIRDVTITLDNPGPQIEPTGTNTQIQGIVRAAFLQITGGDDDDIIQASGITTAATIVGGAGDDSIIGTEADDSLVGDAGNDTIEGGHGNDILQGGDDDDLLLDGAGGDTITAGAGNDLVRLIFEAPDTTVLVDVNTGDGNDVVQIIDSGVRFTNGHTIAVDTGDGDDSILAEPLYGATINAIDGNTHSNGDTLLLNLTNPDLEGFTPLSPAATSGTVTPNNSEFGPIVYQNVEDLVFNSDTTPSYNANGRIDELNPDTGNNFNDGNPDDFSIVVLPSGIVQVTVSGVAQPDRIPINGIQSISVFGSDDVDSLATAQLPFGFNYVGGTSAARDQLRLTASSGTGDVVFRPSSVNSGTGEFELVDGIFTFDDGNQLTITDVELSLVEDFQSFLLQPSVSQNTLTLTSGTVAQNQVDFSVSDTTLDFTTTSPTEGVRLRNVVDVSLDLGVSDGAQPNDLITINNNALRNMLSLETLTIETGSGNDSITINDGNFYLGSFSISNPGGTFLIDGGAASDTISVVASDAAIDTEETDLRFELTASNNTNAQLISRSLSLLTTIELRNFVGELAELTGNATDNLFDLQGWNQLATAIVSGGAGLDTLIALDQPGTTNIWNITGPDTGDVGGFSFDGVEALTGGTTANDRYIFTTDGTLTGAVSGAGGTDTLDFSAYLEAITFNILFTSASGFQGALLQDNSTAVINGGFTGIDRLIGGANSKDELRGLNQNARWDIDGSNQLVHLSVPPRFLDFSGLEILTGGSASDEFVITGTQANSISGGAGDDTLRFANEASRLIGGFTGAAGNDTIDLRTYASTRDVTLLADRTSMPDPANVGQTLLIADGFTGTEASISEGFTGVNAIVGGLAINDTLRGIPDVISLWTITARDTGIYSSTQTGQSLAFGEPTGTFGFENLVGGSQESNTFAFINNGSVRGTLSGGAAFDTIIGDSSRATTEFTVDGLNTGRIDSGGLSVAARFDSIETLTGGAQADTFLFTNAGSLHGPIDGGGGIDKVIGDNDGNQFRVHTKDTGTLTGKANTLGLSRDGGGLLVDFANIETLQGGSGVDTFLIEAILVGDLIGQSGNDVFQFTNTGTILGSVQGGVGTDTLIGDDDGNIFDILGTVNGSTPIAAVGRGQIATKTSLFTAIENLIGGTGNDEFNFTTLGSITGIADGAGGVNSITGDSDGNIFTITSPDAGLLFSKLASFTGIQNLVGGDANDSFNVTATLSGSIIGLVGADIVVVASTGVVMGNIATNESNDSIDIRGTVNGTINGGLGDDTITLQQTSAPAPGAQVNGTISGDDGDDVFNITGSVTLGHDLLGGSGNDRFVFENAGSLNVAINGESGSDTLEGDDDGNDFTVDNPNQGTLPGKLIGSFVSIENLSGGSSADTFLVAGLGTLSGSISGAAGDDLVTVDPGRTVSGSINGDAGNDTITVRDTARVLGSINGGDNNDTFNIDYSGGDIRTLAVAGGNGTDTLNLTGGSTGASGTYTAGPASGAGQYVTTASPNSQIVSFTGLEPVTDTQVLDSLTVNASGGNDTVNIVDATAPGFTGFTEVNFNSAFSPIRFSNKGSVNVNGQGGNDILNVNTPGGSVGLVINVNGDNLPGAALTAGVAGNDTVNLNVSHTGNHTGGAGDDTFVLQAATVLTGSIAGNSGVDTLNALALASNVDVTLTSAGTTDGFDGTVATSAIDSFTFTDLDSLRSGSGNDTLNNGQGAVANWELDGTNRFITTDDFAFSGFENLNGGAGVDNFNITGVQSLAVDAGDGNDTLVLNPNAVLNGPFNAGSGVDTIDFSNVNNAAVSVSLTQVAVITNPPALPVIDGFDGTTPLIIGGFQFVNSFIGGSSFTAIDTFDGLDVASQWTVGPTTSLYMADGATALFERFETLNGGANNDTFSITGNSIANLNGGDGNDVFNFQDAATLTGTIDGGNHTTEDRVDYSAYTTSVSAFANQLVNIESLIDSGEGADSLLGSDGNDIFTIDSANSGTFQGPTGNMTQFRNWENLDGRGGSDRFVFSTDASVVSGTISGGSTVASDTVDASSLSSTIGFVLSGIGTFDGFNGTAGALAASFTNIDSLIGGTSGTDSLRGLDVPASWTVATSGAYQSSGRQLAFNAIENLNGGTAADTFNVTGNVSANITGDAGADVVSVNSNVTLTGTVTTGTENDRVALGTGASVTGAVDGGTGTDTLDYSSATSAITVTLAAAGADEFAGTASSLAAGFSQFDNLIGSSAAGDVLNGRNSDSTWTVSGASTYAATGSGGTFGFASIEILNGGSGADIFNVSGSRTADLSGNAGNDEFNFTNNAARLLGRVSGGAGVNSLDFGGFAAPSPTPVSVTLTGNSTDGFTGQAQIAGSGTALISNGFSEIRNLAGGSGVDTLTGQNVRATWLIAASGSSYLDEAAVQALSFASFENLTGGNDKDDFVVMAAHTGSLSGGEGGDVIDIQNGGSVNGNIFGNNGNDEIFVATDAVVTGSILGGDGDDLVNVNFTGLQNRAFQVDVGTGDDELRLTGGEQTAVQASSVEYNLGASTITTIVDGITQTITFSGIDVAGVSDSLSDRQTADTFTITGTVGPDTISLIDDISNFSHLDFVGIFVPVTFQNKANLFINGGDNADSITLNNPNVGTGLVSIQVDGGDGADSISVQMPLDGTGGNPFGHLNGGAGNDVFTLANGAGIDDGTSVGAVAIDGGTGTDTLDLTTWTGGLEIELTGDTADGFSGLDTTSNALLGDSFAGIDSIIGPSASNDILRGFNVSATWDVDVASQYTDNVTGRGLTFSGFETLTGSDDADSFLFSVSHTGDVIGGAGDDVFAILANGVTITGETFGDAGADTLDLSGITTSDVVVTLSEVGNAGGPLGEGFTGELAAITAGFSNINVIVGGGGSNDSLRGRNEDAIWDLSAAGSQYQDPATNAAVRFGMFENLLGGSAIDSFTIAGAVANNLFGNDGDDLFTFEDGATLTGTIDGGNHVTQDSVDFSAYTTSVAVSVGQFVNIETLLDSGEGADTLFGSSLADTFTITDADDGTVLTAGGGILTFQNWENLDGGAGQDLFLFDSNLSTLSGSINGGATGELDILSASGVTNTVAYVLTGTSANSGFSGTAGALLGTFTNINSLSGGLSSTDSLTGLDAVSTWSIATVSTYSSAGRSLTVAAVENAIGGNAADTFTVSGNVTFNITGNDGADVVTLNPAASLLGTVSTGLGNDRIALGSNSSISGVVNAGMGIDTLDFAGSTSGFDLSLSSATVADASGFDGDFGETGPIGAALGAAADDVLGIESLTGGLGIDSLTGLNTVSTWSIGASNSYLDTVSNHSLTFSGLDTASGQAQVDTFNVTSLVTLDLNGGDGNDFFNFAASASTTGTASGQGGDDLYTFNGILSPTLPTIDGGSHIGGDTVSFAAALSAVSASANQLLNVETIIGTTLIDTLTGTAGDDQFSFTVQNGAGTDGVLNGTLAFLDFEGFNGDAGDDSFNFANGVGVPGALNGGTGADTVNYSAYGSPVVVNLSGASPTSQNVGGPVTSIENATGGSGNDTLTGSSGPNVLIGGAGADRLIDGFGDDVLVGGMGDDVYVLTPGSADIVDESTGDGTDHLDFSTSTGPIVIDLDSTAVQAVLGAHTLQLNGMVENFTGTSMDDVVTASGAGANSHQVAGGSGRDTLIQSDPTVTAWSISSLNGGTVGSIGFSSFENLMGSTGNDTFTFGDQQSVSGTIDGGGGTDELNYTAYTSVGVTVDLASLISIEVLTGGATTDTIHGLATGNAFNVTGVNSGDVNSVLFTGFENLTGNTGDDAFTFGAVGQLTGTLDGNTGVNSLTLSSNDDSVTLLGTGSTTGFAGVVNSGVTVATFTNVTELDAGTGNDTLTGVDSVATWDINDVRVYQALGRQLEFANIQNAVGGSTTDTFNIAGAQTINLSGGAGNDTFTVRNMATLTGMADGGSGDDRLVYEGSTPQSVVLSAAGMNGFSGNGGAPLSAFLNIDSIQGGSGPDTLTGLNVDSTWSLAAGGNTYTDNASQVLSFSSFRTLNGGAGQDVFNVTGSQSVDLNTGAGNDRVNFLTNGSSVTGSLDGGSHTTADVLDYSAITSGASISIGSAVNFESLVGGTGEDTLLGTAGADNFMITGVNSGVIAGLNFSGVEVLDGAAGDDQFVFSNAASVVSVRGQSGADTVDLTAFTSARNVTLSGSDSNGFSGSESATGAFSGVNSVVVSGAINGDQLTGLNGTATWQLGATETYSANAQVLTISGFNTLSGNAGADTFNLTTSKSLTLNGGSGNDRLAIANGATLTGSFSGDAGTDTLDLSAFTGSLTASLTGTGATDGFNIGTASLTGGASNIDAVIAGSGTDTITGRNVAATWSVGASTTYVASGRTISLSNFETRNGGSAADVFNIQANTLVAGRTHLINGNGADDTFNVSFAAGTSLSSTATLELNGGADTTVDRVSFLATAAGDGVRTVGIAHGSAINGSVGVSGLGGASPVTVSGVEDLFYSGDSANNDLVTVTGTASDDAVTLRAAATGGQIFFGGAADYLNPGVAGGALGPDVTVSGVNLTSGLVVDAGSETTADQLLIDNGGMVTPLSVNSGVISGVGLASIRYLDFESLDSDEPLGFTLNAAGDADDGTADDFVVEVVGGTTLQVSTNAGATVLLSLDQVDVASLVVNGSSDDDTLTVDLTNGDSIPAGGITFNGNGQMTGDGLIVIGAGMESGTYTPDSTTSGSGVVGIDGAAITFTGVEPVTVSDMADFTYVAPNGTDLISVDSPAADQNRLSGTTGGVAFDTLTFFDIVGFTVDASAGTASDSDNVTFASDLVASGLKSFTVTTGDGADTVDAANVTSLGLTLNGGAGSDTLTGSAMPDVLNGGDGFDQIVATSTGGFTLTDSAVTGDHTDALSGIEQAVLIAGAGADLVDASMFNGSGGTIQYGNDGNDTLIGSNAGDALFGGAGDDTQIGLGGDDSLNGSSGLDFLDGGDGNDRLRGQGASRDTLFGGAGDDDIDGGAGNDIVYGIGSDGFTLTNGSLVGNGSDNLTSIEFAELVGEAGNDLIDARTFTGIGVTLRGNAGNDTLLGSSGRDVLYGNAGDDVLRGFDGIDSILGSSGADLLDGGEGGDRLRGQGGSHDSLYGGGGNDTLDGGAGTDFVFETANTDFVLTDTRLSGLGNDSLSDVEIVTLTGGVGNNLIDASAVATIATVLDGGDGNDTLMGGALGDRISGGVGNDVVNAGDGDDTVDGNAGNDTLEGGAGTDIIEVTSGGNQTITAISTVGSSTDEYSGFEGALLMGDDGPNVLDASLATLNVTILGGGGDDTLIGGLGDDSIDGGDGTDVLTLAGTNIILTNSGFSGTGSDQVANVEGIFLTAGVGNSRLDASAYTLGPVTLVGGSGDDTLLGGAGNDSIEGNNGNDVINGGGGDDLLRGGGGNDVVDGGDGNDSLIGNSGNDTLRGQGGNDTLQGDDGDDIILGGDGDDVGTGGNGRDGMNGGAGVDNFGGDHGDDTVLGGGGDDSLRGGADNDIVLGGAGDDLVNGNGGVDTLAGNAGNDRFVGFASEIDEAFTEDLFPFLL
jgi:Ca2+-binding RTX toxin-like protein